MTIVPIVIPVTLSLWISAASVILDSAAITGRTATKIVEYPYNLFKSDLTDQCLTIDDEGVSVQDCLPDNDKQHFKISSEPLLCKGV